MNRRAFLGALAAVAATAALDPERLLWVPGAKKIFVPPLALRPDLFRVASVDDLPLDGLSIQIVRQFDWSNLKWINHIDALYGFAETYPLSVAGVGVFEKGDIITFQQ